MTKEIVNKIIIFCTGLLILTLGSRMLLYSDLGVCGMDALSAGIAGKIGVSVGVGIYIVAIILIVTASVLRRERIKIMPIVASILFGTLFDFWGTIIFNNLVTPESLYIKITFFALGLIFGTLGTAIYVSPSVTESSLDYFMLAIRMRFKLSLRVSRIIAELILVVGAFIVNGPIGIGTLVIMVLYGPMLQYFHEKLYAVNVVIDEV